ncbi:hypothetical protein, partial [Heyndrickxia coagulans]|uniref:hypothetical protein n=1 Tax=Heyndrickxia coagulans TaxID=1398 RepID=UPI00041B7AFE
MNPSYDEAEQVLKLPNSYFDRGYKKGIEIGVEKGREDPKKRIFASDSNFHQNVTEGMELQLIEEKNRRDPD